MLPSAERLRRHGLFQRVYNAKKSVSGSLLTLYILEREARSAPRLPLVGFVIGKKEQAKAVSRNRAKRRVREAYRKMRQELAADKEGQGAQVLKTVRKWYAVVWVIKNEVITAQYEEITREVAECLIRAHKKYGR